MIIKQIQALVDEGEALKTIAASFTEISSLKLQKIRQEVLKSRNFFAEVLSVYSLVRQIALQKGKLKIDNNKAISVILTSNSRFFGHIDTDLVKFFLSQTPQGEIIVIGRGGREALTANKFNQFRSIIFKKDMPDYPELSQFINYIKEYQKILIYFPQFKTVLKQVPVAVNVTESQAEALAKVAPELEQTFIFEPEVTKVLAFFDTQIKQVLIQQTFLEAELARTASRLIFMDDAQNNAEKYLETQNELLSQAKRAFVNTQILEIITSMRKPANG